MSKACYVVVNQSTVPAVDLPTGYTQLDYVEGTGDQYVDTGFKPNQNTRLQMDVDVLSMGSSDRFLFGSRAAYQDTAIYLASTSGNSSWLVGYADDVQTISDQCTGRHTIDYNQNTITIDDISHSFTVTTFAPDYNMYLFACNQSGTAIANKYAIMRLYSCKIYDNGTLASNYIPCKNASGTAGLYDLVNSSFVSSATSIDLVAGTAQGNAVKKVKEKYVVVDGVTRKVKKKYVVVDGIAKKVYGYDDVITYDGTATPLSVARGSLAATTVGDYALFGGGGSGDGYNDSYETAVDVYDQSLTRSTATPLSTNRSYLAATTVGDYALFGGGIQQGRDTSFVDAYSGALVRSAPEGLSKERCEIGATTIGNYAIFGFGKAATSSAGNTADVYNASLTHSTKSMSTGGSAVATTVGGYALFASKDIYLDVFDASLTRSTATPLSTNRSYLAATTVGDYALFGGGRGKAANGNTLDSETTVDVYDQSLTRSTATPLSVAREYLAATTVGNYALFGGGYKGESSHKHSEDTVDAYDKSLTRSTATPLSVAREKLSATTVGNYALFGGGRGPEASGSTTESKTTVNVYKYS